MTLRTINLLFGVVCVCVCTYTTIISWLKSQWLRKYGSGTSQKKVMFHFNLIILSYLPWPKAWMLLSFATTFSHLTTREESNRNWCKCRIWWKSNASDGRDSSFHYVLFCHPVQSCVYLYFIFQWLKGNRTSSLSAVPLFWAYEVSIPRRKLSDYR